MGTTNTSRWLELLRAVRRIQPKIDLSTGNPIITPGLDRVVTESLRAAASRHDVAKIVGNYHYYDGWPGLRERIAEWVSAQTGAPWSAERVLICAGAQAALRLAQRLVRARGKRIGLAAGLDFVGLVDPEGPKPGLGGISWAQDRATLRSDALDWSNLGLVALSHPHNPTGTVWSDDELRHLLDEGEHRYVPVLVDSTYAPPCCPLAPGPVPLPAYASLLGVTSFSKVGLAAARVGVVLGTEEHVQQLASLQREALILPPLIGQLVASEWMDRMTQRPEVHIELVEAWSRRWAAMAEPLVSIPGVSVAHWGGGPFLWCRWRGQPDHQVAADLLAADVAVTPASVLRVDPDQGEQALRIGLGVEVADLHQAGHLLAHRLRSAI